MSYHQQHQRSEQPREAVPGLFATRRLIIPQLSSSSSSSSITSTTNNASAALSRSCKQCRKSKVKCTRTLPCERCLRLGLWCTAQDNPKPKKPFATSPSERSFKIKVGKCWRHLNYTPMGAVIKAFFDLEEEKMLVRARALTILRCFAENAEPSMYEPMQSALDMMVKAYDIPSGRHLLYDEKLKKEMEAYTDGNTGRTGSTSNPRATTTNVRDVSQPWLDTVRRAPQSKPTIEGLSSFIKEFFYKPNWACTITIFQEGTHTCFTNELFARMFFPDQGSSSPKGNANLEWWYRSMHPEDNERIAKSVGSMLFGAPTNPCGFSDIVRCRNHKGESFMALFRWRVHLMAGGRVWNNVVAIQPLPTPGFMKDDPETPATTGGSLLPVFERPNDPIREYMPVVITETLPAVDVLRVLFRPMGLEEEELVCRTGQDNIDGRREGLFAAVDSMMEETDEEGPEGTPCCEPPRPPSRPPQMVSDVLEPPPLKQRRIAFGGEHHHLPVFPPEDMVLLSGLFGDSQDHGSAGANNGGGLLSPSRTFMYSVFDTDSNRDQADFLAPVPRELPRVR